MIPIDEMIDVCINEGLRRWAVVGFLCVLRKGREESVVVFEVSFRPFCSSPASLATLKELTLYIACFSDTQETMPRTTMLIQIYHGVREILFDEFDEEEGEVEGDESGHPSFGAGVGNGESRDIH